MVKSELGVVDALELVEMEKGVLGQTGVADEVIVWGV